MKWPWVSRLLYEQTRELLDKREAECEALRAKVIEQADRIALQAVNPPDMSSADLSSIKPLGRETVASVIAQANHSAWVNATKGGDSIPSKMQKFREGIGKA